jgi:putative addiction module component (TIGR02574 family)
VLIERFPEVAKLDIDDQLLLASELVQNAAAADAAKAQPELPPESLALIQARLDDYLADPSTGMSWEEVKQRLKREHGR